MRVNKLREVIKNVLAAELTAKEFKEVKAAIIKEYSRSSNMALSYAKDYVESEFMKLIKERTLK